MTEIQIRNCQIVTVPTKTHIIRLASKLDLPNAEDIVSEFFSRFEIINISLITSPAEIIKKAAISVPQKEKEEKQQRLSVVATYLQIKDMLPEQFTAVQYYERLQTLLHLKHLSSVYHPLNRLVRFGKITEVEGASQRTFKKVYMEEPKTNDSLRKTMASSAPNRFI